MPHDPELAHAQVFSTKTAGAFMVQDLPEGLDGLENVVVPLLVPPWFGFLDAAGTMFSPLTPVTSMTTQMLNTRRPSRDANILTIPCNPLMEMPCAQRDRRNSALGDG